MYVCVWLCAGAPLCVVCGEGNCVGCACLCACVGRVHTCAGVLTSMRCTCAQCVWGDGVFVSGGSVECVQVHPVCVCKRVRVSTVCQVCLCVSVHVHQPGSAHVPPSEGFRTGSSRASLALLACCPLCVLLAVACRVG